MKIYSEPNIELLEISSMDIIQVSGNDPFMSEYSEWNSKNSAPGLSTGEYNN